MVENNGIELTEAEFEQYDRQIRLWGLESQKRMRAAKVLLIGLNGLGAEVAKNIILAGVKSVTLMDNEPLAQIDLFSQFLCPPDKVGQNRAEISLERARALNPMVLVTVDKTPVSEFPANGVREYDIVCATDVPKDQLLRLNAACRSAGVRFLCGNVWGMFGYMFSDLLEHEFSEEVIKYPAKKRTSDGQLTASEPIVQTIRSSLEYPSLAAALSADWSKPELRSRLKRGDPSYFVTQILLSFREKTGRNPMPESRADDITTLQENRNKMVEENNLPPGFIPDQLLSDVVGVASPAAAVVGGVLAQEVLRAASLSQRPHHNMFFFNPIKCLGFVELYGVSSENKV